jgi:hypothetical protein
MTRWLAVFFSVAVVALSGSPAPGQTAGTGLVMRQKLVHAQGVLEAITTSDYELLRTHTSELRRATQTLGWQVLKTPEYRRFSNTFVDATENLAQAAADRDLDAAVTHYMSMTLSCYQCHRYIKASRIAGR